MASVDSVPVEMTNVSAGGFFENLLLLEFRDGLRPARFGDGKCDFVARVHRIQHAVLRSIVVTVPVSACWAKVTELMTVSIEPAKTIFASLIEIPRLLNVRDKSEPADWFPWWVS